jgi:phage-related tail fiber protein
MASVTTHKRRGINATAAIKVACIAGSTANLTLSGEQTVDGIALVEDDRVLVKDQTDGTENGIYEVATGSWVRAPDFDGAFDVNEGTIVPVSRGTVNADTYWKLTNIGDIAIGTTALTFSATTVLSSAILNDGSVKMIADFEPNVTATYALGGSTAEWTSVYLSSAMNSNSAVISSNAVVSGALTSSGTATMSSDIVGSRLTTALSGTDPGVEGQIWVSTSTGATAGKILLVSTG